MSQRLLVSKYILPVCRFEQKDNQAIIKETLGTAFFINNTGIFITAKHVINDSKNALKNNEYIGLMVLSSDNKSLLACRILDYNFADEPYDIAIGKTEHVSQTDLLIEKSDATIFTSVKTLGYPASATIQKANNFLVNARAHEGYIQRIITPDDQALSINGQNQPYSFELSFVVSYGLSGSPLFKHSQSKDILIGVCVGSHTIELKGVREEFGIAQDIQYLHSWKPSLLKGKCLIDKI